MSEDEAERELFDHLVAEFGDRGQDARPVPEDRSAACR
jgi:hypothetical protein